MNWYALRFFAMVIVLSICVLAAGWALNYNRSDFEPPACYPDGNDLPPSQFTYQIIEIAPQNRPDQDYDPNQPEKVLPIKKKYREHPRIDDRYKIEPVKAHLLQIPE